MFRRTSVSLARSAYSVFMMQVKNHPKLQGLPIAKRGRETAKLYRALSKSEAAALKAKAAKLPSFKRKAKAPRKPRKPSKYNLFVSANIHKMAGKNIMEKMRKVAKLWKQTQKQAQKK